MGRLLVFTPILVAAVTPLPRGRRRLPAPAALAVMAAGAAIEAPPTARSSAAHSWTATSDPEVLDTGLRG